MKITFKSNLVILLCSKNIKTWGGHNAPYDFGNDTWTLTKRLNYPPIKAKCICMAKVKW
jgi:hypothetical protein